MRHIVKKRNRRIQEAIGEALLEIREHQQTFSQLRSVAQEETPHTAELVRALAALDRAFGDGGMPAIMAVEIAQEQPDAVGRGIDDRRTHDSNHSLNLRTDV